MNRTARAALAIFAAGAIAPVAAQAAPKPKAPTLATNPSTVVAGSPVTLSGKLTGPNNAGQTINVLADPYPFDNVFTNVGSATTNNNGDYQLTHEPTINTRYQARRGNENSPIVTVLVRPRVSLRLSDYTPKRGQVVRFSGRVCPQHDGALVAIQRRYSTGYRTIRRARLKDIVGSTCSKYSRRLRVYRDGRFRTVIRGHAAHARGTSRSRVANAHR